MTRRARILGALLLLAGGASTSARDTFDLHAAIADAAPGATVAVPPGTYLGPIVIDRALVLDGGGHATLDGGGEGDVVRITAADVTIRGFTICNTGHSLDRENAGIAGTAPRVTIADCVLESVLFGIYLKSADGSVVRGNTIRGMDLPVQRRGDGIRIWQCTSTIIEDNLLDGCRDAVMWFSNTLQIRGNHVRNGRYGLHFMYSDGNVIEGNRLERNSVGAFLMYSKDLVLRDNVFAHNRGPSGYGLGLKDMDRTSGERNLFVGNRVGLHLDSTPASLRVTDTWRENVFAFNDIGVSLLPAVERNRFTDNAFVENIEQVGIVGGTNADGNSFTVDGRGNWWSDYRGFDRDGDGIGDLPYRADDLFENLMDREPRLRLFLHTPAQRAVDLAARAVPAVRPQPKLADTAPLVHPVLLDVDRRAGPTATRGAEPQPARLAGIALVLLALGASIVAAARTSFRVPNLEKQERRS